MEKINLINKNDLKKWIIEMHQSIDDLEESIAKTKSVDELHSSLFKYLDLIHKSYNKVSMSIINFPFDKNCDKYMILLNKELAVLFDEFSEASEDDDYDETLSKYIFQLIDLIKARERRISYMNALLSFLKHNKINIKKDDIYKEINFKNCSIIKSVKFDKDELLIKNELFINDLLNIKFKEIALAIAFDDIYNEKSYKNELLTKEKIIDILDDIIASYHELGISFSDAYKTIAFERITSFKNYEIIRISFLDDSIKNLMTFTCSYKDFVFVKNCLNHSTILFYSLEGSNLYNQSIIFENVFSERNTPVYVSFKKELFDKLLNKDMVIKKENSLYRIVNDNTIEYPNNKIYKTVEFVEEIINSPLITIGSNMEKARENCLFSCTLKEIGLIYTQTIEDIKKEMLNSQLITDVDSNIRTIIEILNINKKFTRILDNYNNITLDKFVIKMQEMQDNYEKIIINKQKKIKKHNDNIEMPLPILLLFIDQSLNILLNNFEFEERHLSKKLVNKIYDEIKSNKKLHNKLMNLQNGLMNFNFDDDDYELDDFEKPEKIYKA